MDRTHHILIRPHDRSSPQARVRYHTNAPSRKTNDVIRELVRKYGHDLCNKGAKFTTHEITSFSGSVTGHCADVEHRSQRKTEVVIWPRGEVAVVPVALAGEQRDDVQISVLDADVAIDTRPVGLG